MAISKGINTYVETPIHLLIRTFANLEPVEPPLLVTFSAFADASKRLWSAKPDIKNEVRLIIR